MASSSTADQQQQLPPNEHQQDQQYSASNHQQQQEYNDNSRAHPHHQLEASQIPSQGHSGCSAGGGGGSRSGRGHDGGINPNTSTPLTYLPPAPLPPLQLLCEICLVECNSLQMLAQHKNGKKHRKAIAAIQTYEEMQKQGKVIAKYQSNFVPGSIHTIGHQQANAMPDTKQTIECQQANVIPSNASGYQQENAMPASAMHLNSVIDNASSVAEQEIVLPTSKSITKAGAPSSQLEPPKASEIVCNNVQADANKSHSEEIEQKGRIATTEGTAELPICVEQEGKVETAERTTKLPNTVEQNGKVATTNRAVESSMIGNDSKLDAKQGGIKRVISNGSWSGKRLKKYNPEPHRICTVCNVVCESVASFESHIAGKKHFAKLRIFQQHGAVFGPMAVYIPPNQPILFPTNRPDPIYYGLNTYQMVAQVMNSFDGAQLCNLQSQDAPSVVAQKEKTELEGNVDNVANCDAQESDSKEIDDKPTDDDDDVGKMNDDALTSESKDAVNLETGDATELLVLDSELKEKSISETSDTLKVSEDFALDSASEERNNNGADGICKV